MRPYWIFWEASRPLDDGPNAHRLPLIAEPLRRNVRVPQDPFPLGPFRNLAVPYLATSATPASLIICPMIG